MGILNDIYQDGIKWHDIACYHTKPYVCEDSDQLLDFVRASLRAKGSDLVIPEPPEELEVDPWTNWRSTRPYGTGSKQTADRKSIWDTLYYYLLFSRHDFRNMQWRVAKFIHEIHFVYVYYNINLYRNCHFFEKKQQRHDR